MRYFPGEWEIWVRRWALLTIPGIVMAEMGVRGTSKKNIHYILAPAKVTGENP